MPASPALLSLIDDHGGALPFEDFMGAALYDPRGGYYTARIRGVGARGDFSTAVTLAGVLGQAVAGWISGLDPTLPIIEVGAGTGALAEQIRGALGVRGATYGIVEVSPRLRELQRERLGDGVAWYPSVADALAASDGRGVVLSNELVDAFPCAIYQRQGGRWRRLVLTREGDEVVEGFDDFEDPRLSAARPAALALTDAGRVELHLSYRDWQRAWLPGLRHGHVLTIDYGDDAARVYHRRPRGTVRGFFSHLRMEGPEVYARFGHQDLTADVCFDDLDRWGRDAGLRTRGRLSQGQFIQRHAGGVIDPADPAQAFVLSPMGMGGAVQVLWQSR